jgi:hypothetical protein
VKRFGGAVEGLEDIFPKPGPRTPYILCQEKSHKKNARKFARKKAH